MLLNSDHDKEECKKCDKKCDKKFKSAVAECKKKYAKVRSYLFKIVGQPLHSACSAYVAAPTASRSVYFALAKRAFARAVRHCNAQCAKC
jgi:hypothetical protein